MVWSQDWLGILESRTDNHLLVAFATELLWEELTIVANASEATVIFLHSHPAWAAAQRRARERSEAMRRHPSLQARRRAAGPGDDVAPVIRAFKVYSSTDTSA
jgi:hypothetical protein